MKRQLLLTANLDVVQSVGTQRVSTSLNHRWTELQPFVFIKVSLRDFANRHGPKKQQPNFQLSAAVGKKEAECT